MIDAILTIHGYHDGPIKGLTEFVGKPHYYDCEFDENADEYSDVFRLTPLSAPIFELAMEQWAIWQRWKSAFDEGSATVKSHPALPEDRVRHDEIERAISTHIEAARPSSFRARGRFIALPRAPSLPPSRPSAFQVEWTKLAP